MDDRAVEIMTMATSGHRSFRLTPREMRTEQHPDVVLPSEQARALLTAARAQDVSLGGCFSPGPAGVQVWDRPWNGAGGRVGTAEHLGSVDWSWDAPAEGFVTVYRVLLTAAGVRAGFAPQSLLDLLLTLSSRRPQGPGGIPLPRSAASGVASPVS